MENQANLTATSLKDYVAIASSLAKQGPRDGADRMSLRHSVQNSALADGQRLSRELEHHYWTLRKKVSSF